MKNKTLALLLAGIFLVRGEAFALPCADQLVQARFSSGQAIALCASLGSAYTGNIAVSGNATISGNISIGGTSTMTGAAQTGTLTVLVSGDPQRQHLLTASSDTALQYYFGDSGVTAVQQLFVGPSTADADDDASLLLSGGGAMGGTRGASITLPGEEVSGGSDITYNAGTSDTHIFQTAGVQTALLSAAGLLTLTDGLTVGGNITSTVTTGTQIAGTGTAGFWQIAGGASASDSSGAFAQLYGNTHASTGVVNISAGNAAGGNVNILAPHSAADIIFGPGGTTKWTMGDTGTLIGAGTATIGWTVIASGAGVACTDACTTPCVAGQNATFGLEACSVAVTGWCICAGAS